MADQSEPRSNNVALVGILAALFFFGLLIASLYFLPFVIHGEIHDKIETAPTTGLDSLRADETEKLTQPAYVDKAGGVVRIPVELAMDLEAKHPWRQDLPVAASTFPTSTTATATKATTSTATTGGKKQ